MNLSQTCLNPPRIISFEIRSTLTVIGIITCIIGIILNGFSLASLIYSRQLFKKPFTLLLANLAVADILFCLRSFLTFINYFVQLGNHQWFIKHPQYCQFKNFLSFSTSGADWGTAMLIGCERYISVCKTSYYKTIFSWNKTLVYLCVLWVFELYNVFFQLFEVSEIYGWFVYTGYADPCDIQFKRLSAKINFIAHSFLPFAFITLFYGAIYRKIRKYQNWRKRAAQQAPAWVKKNNNQLTRTSFYVCLMYLVCVVSLGIVRLVDICKQYGEMRLLVFSVYWQMYYLNNFMYILRIRVYRDACMALYRKLNFWPLLNMKTVSLRVDGKPEPVYAIGITFKTTSV